MLFSGGNRVSGAPCAAWAALPLLLRLPIQLLVDVTPGKVFAATFCSGHKTLAFGLPLIDMVFGWSQHLVSCCAHGGGERLSAGAKSDDDQIGEYGEACMHSGPFDEARGVCAFVACHHCRHLETPHTDQYLPSKSS